MVRGLGGTKIKKKPWKTGMEREIILHKDIKDAGFNGGKALKPRRIRVLTNSKAFVYYPHGKFAWDGKTWFNKNELLWCYSKIYVEGVAWCKVKRNKSDISYSYVRATNIMIANV